MSNKPNTNKPVQKPKPQHPKAPPSHPRPMRRDLDN